MKEKETFYTSDRNEWRKWLSENFETKTEIWFVFPTKDSGEPAEQFSIKDERKQDDSWVRWYREVLQIGFAEVLTRGKYYGV